MTAKHELEATERDSGSAVQECSEMRELPAAELAQVEGGYIPVASILCSMCMAGTKPQ